MVQAARDSVAIAKYSRAGMDAYGKEAILESVEIPAISALNSRGEYSATLGVFPPWARPFIRHLPWFRRRKQSHLHIDGLAVFMVAKRLSTTSERNDLLNKLQQGKDNKGEPMDKEEITAEALTQLIAGSDTSSRYVYWVELFGSILICCLPSASCAIAYYLARYPHVQAKLQNELDDHLGTDDEVASNSEQAKRMPYLEAVINESLRLHSTSGIGLPRIVPEGGITILGRHFPEGTTVSVPSYSIHRDRKVWGNDAEDFRPERWFERDQATLQKAFSPFSFGPR
jgi:benzoate 4-monooxygenase